MIRVRTRQLVRVAHRWTGLVVALFLILQATTGVMLTFKDELAWRVDPAMRASAFPVGDPRSARISPDIALERALAALPPGCAPDRLYFPKHERGVFLVKCTHRDSGDELRATVDPWNGHVIAAGGIWQFPFELADELHLDWRIERPGQVIIGTLGCVLLALAISGFFVWWPGKRHALRAMRPVWRGGVRTRLRMLHRLVGPIVAGFVVLFISAGVVTAWRPWVEPLVGKVLPLAKPPSVESVAARAANGERLTPLLDVERLALAALPGATVRDMRNDGGAFEVIQLVMNPAHESRPRAADHVWVDRRSERLLGVRQTATEPAGTRLLGWVLPLHTGQAYGLGGRVFMLLVGLSVLTLAVSGTIATLRRRRM